MDGSKAEAGEPGKDGSGTAATAPEALCDETSGIYVDLYLYTLYLCFPFLLGSSSHNVKNIQKCACSKKNVPHFWNHNFLSLRHL